MNEKVPKVSLKRRRFTVEFKQDAVRLVVSEGYTLKAAAAVGVSEQTLRYWHARLAPKPAGCGSRLINLPKLGSYQRWL